MAYTAQWVAPGYTTAWPTPPQGALGTVHLIGDTHFAETDAGDPIWPVPRDDTNVDAIARDLNDGLLSRVPDAVIQTGDLTDNGAPRSYGKMQREQQIAADYKARYGLDWHQVVGNHDMPRNFITGDEWAQLWGTDHPYYTVDLGAMRVIVLGPVDNNWTEDIFELPCGPFGPTVLDWLDARLSEDSRPTLLAWHPPLAKEPTANPDAISGDKWWTVQATIDAAGVVDTTGQALQDIIGAHTHVVGWMHSHTHDPYGSGGRGANVNLVSVGGRNVAAIDTGAVLFFTAAKRVPPITSYVSLMDDGRSVEVRWRHHDHRLWLGDVAGGGRVKRLVVP